MATLRRLWFFTSIGSANIAFFMLLSLFPFAFSIAFLNACIIALTLLLAAGYWKFCVNVWSHKRLSRSELFGISIILMWIGIAAFRFYNVFNSGRIDFMPGGVPVNFRSKVLLFGQFNVMLAAGLQLYAARMFDDYANQPTIRRSLYAIAFISFLFTLYLQRYL